MLSSFFRTNAHDGIPSRRKYPVDFKTNLRISERSEINRIISVDASRVSLKCLHAAPIVFLPIHLAILFLFFVAEVDHPTDGILSKAFAMSF